MTRSYKAKNLANYPRVFFEIVERHARGEAIPMLSQVNKQSANSNQRLWHKFRSALISNQHSYSEAAIDIICSIANAGATGKTGIYYLSFDPRGAVRMARELKGLDPMKDDELLGLEVLDAPTPQLGAEKFIAHVQTFDKAEDAIMRFIKEEVPPTSPLGCEHEWDMYDVCLKCKAPKV